MAGLDFTVKIDVDARNVDRYDDLQRIRDGNGDERYVSAAARLPIVT